MPATGYFRGESSRPSPDGQAARTGACDSSVGRYTLGVTGLPTESALYFFPEEPTTVSELEMALAGEDRERRAWAISHLLRYALWEDIWIYVSRDDVREIFAELDLPESLRIAWGRMLKVEAPVA